MNDSTHTDWPPADYVAQTDHHPAPHARETFPPVAELRQGFYGQKLRASVLAMSTEELMRAGTSLLKECREIARESRRGYSIAVIAGSLPLELLSHEHNTTTRLELEVEAGMLEVITGILKRHVDPLKLPGVVEEISRRAFGNVRDEGEVMQVRDSRGRAVPASVQAQRNAAIDGASTKVLCDIARDVGSLANGHIDPPDDQPRRTGQATVDRLRGMTGGNCDYTV
jgi:hypothetical protein